MLGKYGLLALYIVVIFLTEDSACDKIYRDMLCILSLKTTF